ncbi:MAG: hypothetical protein ACE5HI_15265, partial [bacterium]
MRTLIAFSTVLLLALFVLLGCEQPTVNSPTKEAVVLESGSFLQKGRPSYPNPVKVTFADDATSYNIRSDKNEPYIDKEDGVRAYINHPNTDDLILDTDYYFRPRKGAVPRKVFFDLTQPVSGSGAIERGTQTLVAFLNVDKLYDVSSATGFVQFNFGGYILRFGVEDGT